MALIPAKCTQCGANIEIDGTKEAGICPSCGTAFITEKAINNYNTYITNNIVLDSEIKENLLKGANEANLKTAAERCESLLRLKKYYSLEEEADKIIEKWPDSPIGYKYKIMTYEEFQAYDPPEYNGVFAGRKKYLEHPMNANLKWYVDCLKTEQEKAANQEFIDKAQNICDDFCRYAYKHAIRNRNLILACMITAFALGIAFIFLTVFIDVLFLTGIIIFFAACFFTYMIPLYNRDIKWLRQNKAKALNELKIKK